MEVLKVLSKNDHAAISECWKSAAAGSSAKKVMLFHTLAMLDPERLHAWIASTPVDWWDIEANRGFTIAELSASIAGRYEYIAGGLLHYLHLENRTVFLQLLEKSPQLFKSATCKSYMDEWCKDLSPAELVHFQPMLATQPAGWYVTAPWRINLLLPTDNRRELELMLAVAVAENGMIHPTLEEKFPGAEACICVAHGMFTDTKQKKNFLRNWMFSEHGLQKETLVLELPVLDAC